MKIHINISKGGMNPAFLILFLNQGILSYAIGRNYQNQSNYDESSPITQNSLTPTFHAGVVVMIACLSLILSFLLITLFLPIKVQNAVFFCFRRHDPVDLVNIDVGLYKTRQAMYRPEVYSTEMRRPWKSNNNTRLQRLSSTKRVLPYNMDSCEEASCPRKKSINKHFSALDSCPRYSNLVQPSEHYTNPCDPHGSCHGYNQEYTTERPSMSLPLFKFEAVDIDESPFPVAHADRTRSVSCASNYATNGIHISSGNHLMSTSDLNPPYPSFEQMSKSDTNILFPRCLDCPQCVAELNRLQELQSDRMKSRKPSIAVSDKSANRSVSFADDVDNGTGTFFLC